MKNCINKCLFSLRLADLFGMLRPVSAMIVKRGHQYLIVQKPRKEHAWQFPQGGQDKGETKLEAGLRELAEECGESLKVTWKDAPVGTYRYLFPSDFMRHKKSQTQTGNDSAIQMRPKKPLMGYIGAKVTFFVAEYKDGDVNLDPKELLAHGWVSEDNLIDYFDESYYKVVEPIIQKL